MNLRFAGTLFYYDGIQVFEARDKIGGHYIAVRVAEAKDNDEPLYAIVGVAPGELQRLRLGSLGLAEVMRAVDIRDEWYIGVLEGTDSETRVVAELQSGRIPLDFIPDEGFTLSPPLEAVESIRKEAIARNALAFELQIDGPKSTNEHRLSADVVGGLLIHIQSLVKNAYRKAVSLAGMKGDREMALMDVAVPAAVGSFKILLVPSQFPNLFRGYEVSRALEVVDYLLAEASNPTATLDRLRQFTGHTATSFVRLLRFMRDADLALHYSWSSPEREAVSRRVLTQQHTVPLLALLSMTENLGIEKVSLRGVLEEADKVGSWRMLSDEDGKLYRGKAREGVSLSDLSIDHRYAFECEEESEEVTGTGREIPTLYLLRWQQLGSK